MSALWPTDAAVTEAQRILHASRRPLTTPAGGLAHWSAALNQRGYSPSTINNYRLCVARLLASDPDPDLLAIEAHLSDLRSRGHSSNSIVNHIKAYKSFWTYLQLHNLVTTNPTLNLQYPRQEHKERPVPPPDHIRALLAQPMTLRDRLLLVLFLDTGARLTEVASIRLDAVDLTTLAITLDGKGHKQRTVPISPETGALLYAYINTDRARRPNARSPWLFPARRHDSATGYIAHHRLQVAVADLCKKAGIPHYTPHQLRHFFATYALTTGADVKAVSRILGHASVATTLDIYHHVDADAVRRTHGAHTPLNMLRRAPNES